MAKGSRSSRFQPVDFNCVDGKKVRVEAVPEQMTGHGGAILIAAAEEKVGLVKEMARWVNDERDQRKVKHPAFDMVLQRVCQIATGNGDGNDCDWLRGDAAIKTALGRHPRYGKDGASQETISRFESKQDEETFERLRNLFLDFFLRYIRKKRPKRNLIELDIDGSPIETHGAQEGAVYRGGNKYGYEMYFPLFVFSGRWLLSVTLRTGTASESKTVVAELEHCVKRIRAKWAGIRIRARFDAAFGSPQLYNWCRKNNVAYIVGMKSTSVLELYTREAVAEAERQFREKFDEPLFMGKDGDKKAQAEHARIRNIKDKHERMKEEKKLSARRVRVFHELSHKAESWQRWERIIARVDFTDKGPDVRYIMVSTQKGRPQAIYRDIYCQRGLMEQLIGRYKKVGKSLSAQTFGANQFRLILNGVVYQLLEYLKDYIATTLRSCEPTTIQRDLLAMPAVFRETQTMIVMQISEGHPHCREFLAACRNLKAA